MTESVQPHADFLPAASGFDVNLSVNKVTPDGQNFIAQWDGFRDGVQVGRFTLRAWRIAGAAPAGVSLAHTPGPTQKGEASVKVFGTVFDGPDAIAKFSLTLSPDPEFPNKLSALPASQMLHSHPDWYHSEFTSEFMSGN